MSIFGPVEELPEVEWSEQRMASMLRDIKKNSRNRRIAMFAPVALAAAVLATLVAAPPRYGGLALVPDAEADSATAELPRVFGMNGVWRLPVPITDNPATDPGPAAVVEVPTAPNAPSFVLSPPTEDDLNSLPVSPSTPPTATLGQSPDTTDPVELDWSQFAAVIRVQETPPEDPAETDAAETDPAETAAVETATDADESTEPQPVDPAPVEAADLVAADQPVDQSSDVASTTATDADALGTGESSTDESSTDETSTDETSTGETGADESVDTDLVEADPVETSGSADADSTNPDTNDSSSPVPAASAQDTATPDISSPDEAEQDALDQANPSTPVDAIASEAPEPSAPASIIQRSVLVHSAHVSVTVQVVDDDSSVIDWCNTRVDWGDGSVTGVVDTDGVATCTASCEYEATPSGVDSSPLGSIDQTIEFTHEYTQVIDAAPRIYVATGDGCSYTLAELQLNPFTVVPY